jgi:HEAT repeat protein
MDERFTNNQPIDEQPKAVIPVVQLALFSSLLVVPLTFIAWILMNPAGAQAALSRFTHLIELRGGRVSAAPANSPSRMHEGIATSGPQRQAEQLLEKSLSRSDDSLEQLSAYTDEWRGLLTMTPRLTSLLNLALNSDDRDVRTEGLDLELAVYDLPKTSQSADQLVARIKSDPSARPWALWMLGAIGSQGIEPDRALSTLLAYAHDPDEKTRYWAVAGISLLGTDATIQPMLDILRNDSSAQVRESAGCGLAQSGMLTKKQRMTAVPTLLRYTEDPTLDPSTRSWVYLALRDITGATVANSPAAWRSWWDENSSSH